ncbi:MAG TPA: BACON domain-containing protein [Candidatus Avibacteroides excrementipullorum]|nr:BACON domain-containing protein [Candidatus Avibacteroides excrementipullorum]
MIKKLLYYFAVGLMLLCASCGRLIDDQMGFPGTVTFSKEGGEKIVKGDREEGPFYFYIEGDDRVASPLEGVIDGYYVAKYKWLTVKSPMENEALLIITVEPNASGKSRKLEVTIGNGLKRAYIKVKQK